jgi:hypothetical protein
MQLLSDIFKKEQLQTSGKNKKKSPFTKTQLKQIQWRKKHLNCLLNKQEIAKCINNDTIVFELDTTTTSIEQHNNNVDDGGEEMDTEEEEEKEEEKEKQEEKQEEKVEEKEKEKEKEREREREKEEINISNNIKLSMKRYENKKNERNKRGSIVHTSLFASPSSEKAIGREDLLTRRNSSMANLNITRRLSYNSNTPREVRSSSAALLVIFGRIDSTRNRDELYTKVTSSDYVHHVEALPL